MAKFCANQQHGAQYVGQLVEDMRKDKALMESLELIVKPNSSCKIVGDNVVS